MCYNIGKKGMVINMKKSIICIVLALSMLLFSACSAEPIGSSIPSEAALSSEESESQSADAPSEESEPEPETPSEEESESSANEDISQQETYYKSENGVIEAEYFVTKDFPIVEDAGKYYFDFTPESFLEAVNAFVEENMTDPTPYSFIDRAELDALNIPAEYVGFENEAGVVGLLAIDPDNGNVSAVGAGTSEALLPPGVSNELSHLSVQSVAFLMVVDPNMVIGYAGMVTTDMSIAGMISGPASDLYAYSSSRGRVGYNIVQIGDVLTFVFVPLPEGAINL